MAAPLITLTTDFGHKDGYAGIVKGVVLSILPRARLVDLSHEVPPFDIRAGAWIINNAYPYFPQGTVHLVVVDPGVGSSRQRSIIVEAGGATFVAPDNGVLSYVLDENPHATAHELKNKEYFLSGVSSSFHARDIYAPVAAHIAAGAQPNEMGPELSLKALVRFAVKQAAKSDRCVMGQIVYVDRFGNLVSNIQAQQVGRAQQCFLNGQLVATISKTYSSGAKGEPVAFIASHGHLEIAVSQGRACDVLKAGIGSSVRLATE